MGMCVDAAISIVTMAQLVSIPNTVCKVSHLIRWSSSQVPARHPVVSIHVHPTVFFIMSSRLHPKLHSRGLPVAHPNSPCGIKPWLSRVSSTPFDIITPCCIVVKALHTQRESNAFNQLEFGSYLTRVCTHGVSPRPSTACYGLIRSPLCRQPLIRNQGKNNHKHLRHLAVEAIRTHGFYVQRCFSALPSLGWKNSADSNSNKGIMKIEQGTEQHISSMVRIHFRRA